LIVNTSSAVNSVQNPSSINTQNTNFLIGCIVSGVGS
jgi:hypothetical protein